ncbi:MAG: hypothetical protein ACM3SU_05805 [Acidobacteriota bacterium]
MASRATPPRLPDPDAALRRLVAVTASVTGRPFFEALVESLSRCLEAQGAWVAELVPERRRRRGLAFWSGGRLIPDFEYELAGTPCELVIDQRGLVNFSEGVADLFPTDSDPKALSAVRDMGAPLVDLLPASP